jgi:hypothetical protein
VSKQKIYSGNVTPNVDSTKNNNAVKLPRGRQKKTRGRERQQQPKVLVAQGEEYEALALAQVSVEHRQVMVSVAGPRRLEARVGLEELAVG